MAVSTSALRVAYFTCIWTFAMSFKVKSGDDVTLQCQNPRDETITTLTWIRPDLKKTDGYVFFFRENQPHESYQHPSFRGRVQLRDPEMKDGNFSVILKNVNINDAGTYQCRGAVHGKGFKIMNSINLKVEDSGHTAGNTEGHKDGGDEEAGNPGLTVGLPVAAVLFLLVVVVGFLIHRQCRQRPDQHIHYTAAVLQEVKSLRSLNS